MHFSFYKTHIKSRKTFAQHQTNAKFLWDNLVSINMSCCDRQKHSNEDTEKKKKKKKKNYRFANGRYI
jgi:hypothetical protein